jgi:hypothetical protein
VNKDSAFCHLRSPLSVWLRVVLAFVVVPALVLVSNVQTAMAVPLSPQDTQRSEELGESGVAAYEAGNLEQAKAQLEEGYRLSGWGTIGVWLAKTYDKLGLTSDAYRVYIEVASAPAVAGEPEPFVQARVQAQQGADAIAATAGIVRLKSAAPKPDLSVSVDGRVTPLTPANTLAVVPGAHTFDVTWRKGKLPRQNLTLVAGQAQDIELDGVTSRERRQPVARDPVIQNLNFTLAAEEQGWSLVDGSGKELCQLPCKWSGSDAESLVVKRGDQVLPVRLGRKLERQVTMDVSVNPRRGSKAWALGIGIPSGVLFGASALGLSNSTLRTRTPLIISTSVFGAGFAACAWWFVWSKSRPYLDYDVVEASTHPKTNSQASLSIDWLGTGLGVSGTF